MTRVVRNKSTGNYVHMDFHLVEAFEYDDIKQATIFNEEIDELNDADVLEYVLSGYGGEDVELEIVSIKIINENGNGIRK